MRVEIAAENASVQSAAVGFYAVSNNLNRAPSADLDHEQSRPRAYVYGPPSTPRERQHQTEAESSKPQVVSVEPGLDTAALMEATEAIAISSVSLCEVGHELGKVGASDSTNHRTGEFDLGREESLPSTGSHEQGSSSTRPKETIMQQIGNSNSVSDSDTETEVIEGEGWLQTVMKALTIRAQLQRQLEENAQTISRLKRRNTKKKSEIEQLKYTISVLQEHSNQMEGKYKDAETLLREASASTAELKNDIARLSNALPAELTKDDQYFKARFSGIFFSLESWVLQYFMHSKITSSNLQLLPAELTEGLSRIWGEGWRSFAVEETLHTIEAVAMLIIQHLVFDTRILGILGNFFPAIEEHFGSCSVDEINAWRMQTIRMIVADKGFPLRLERRVCEVAEHIEKVLGPLADSTPNNKRTLARMRRLKTIVEHAAELALECNKEPSTFSFDSFSLDCKCQSKYMTDAHRTVDDEHIGADGACVKFTVSPAVLRVPKNPNDEPIVIMKARVVRHNQGSPGGKEGCQTHDQDGIDEISSAQLDLAFGSREN